MTQAIYNTIRLSQYFRELQKELEDPSPKGPSSDGGFLIPRHFCHEFMVMCGGNKIRGRRKVVHRHRFRKARKLAHLRANIITENERKALNA